MCGLITLGIHANAGRCRDLTFIVSVKSRQARGIRYSPSTVNRFFTATARLMAAFSFVSVPAVSHDSGRTPRVGLDKDSVALADQGYLLVSDQMVGLPKNFRQTFLATYFNDHVLHHDDGDLPIDRKRARDVIRYQWRGSGLVLQEHETITITNRAGILGKRDHTRVKILSDPHGTALVHTFLSLVPPTRRHDDGTFGINLFRTHTNVVSKPHRDHEEYVILYVLDRIGGGAESRLYNASDVSAEEGPMAEPVLKHQLKPGEILIFDDERFIHDATPLESLPDGTAQRDVLVCTVDYRSTYLGEEPLLGGEGVLASSQGR
jgi:hypothetical protein